MTTGTSSRTLNVAIGGCILSFMTWVLAARATRSVFGDVFAPVEAERDRIIAAIDVEFRFYLILAAMAFVASTVIAAWAWRRFPLLARITAGVHLTAVTVLLALAWL